MKIIKGKQWRYSQNEANDAQKHDMQKKYGDNYKNIIAEQNEKNRYNIKKNKNSADKRFYSSMGNSLKTTAIDMAKQGKISGREAEKYVRMAEDRMRKG